MTAFSTSEAHASDAVQARQPLEPVVTTLAERHTALRWLVHETGRIAHLVSAGEAVCGEAGTGWRTVAGVPHCPQCRMLEPDQPG